MIEINRVYSKCTYCLFNFTTEFYFYIVNEKGVRCGKFVADVRVGFLLILASSSIKSKLLLCR